MLIIVYFIIEESNQKLQEEDIMTNESGIYNR